MLKTSTTPQPLPINITVIFILGGPGSGMGTQYSTLTTNYHHLHHLSIGDILRTEMSKPTSEYAGIIQKNMTEGRIGPPEITVGLLKVAMVEAVVERGVKVFLVDGRYLRNPSYPKIFEDIERVSNLIYYYYRFPT